jgi:hypothetical protein
MGRFHFHEISAPTPNHAREKGLTDTFTLINPVPPYGPGCTCPYGLLPGKVVKPSGPTLHQGIISQVRRWASHATIALAGRRLSVPTNILLLS